ncbi:ABC transporter permease [Heyndrickxia acidicola]|uniref:ABC transporter permease n=1 Tax=Heyndrickxia acidicola TaxID=209389 RepID=A0ABU6MCU3_9BACI|nr:ABC transporter permease [Heyndrickxia acidicola]MED1202254.1 ABC transporter permease [Heyndrickxia acidicola]
MKDILWLVQNTLRTMLKSKRSVVLFILTPLIGLFIAFLSNGGVNSTILKIGVVQEENTGLANDTVQYLKGMENVKVQKLAESQINGQLSSGKADCVITLGQGYEKSIQQGQPGHIELISIKGAQVTEYVKSYLYHYINNIAAISRISKGNAQTFNKIYADYQKPNVKVKASTLEDTSKEKGMTSQTIGYLIMIMLISAGSLSEIILKEKENRTYYRLLSTPINARKYVIANILVNLIVMVVQIVLTLVIMNIVHIHLNMPSWEMLIILLVFSLVAIGFAQVTIAFAGSTSASSALQNLFIVPTCLISGCFFPVDIMPKALQRIADFLPQHWVLETITKLQNGDLLQSVYLNFLILLAFAAVFFLIAVFKFSRNSSTKNFV